MHFFWINNVLLTLMILNFLEVMSMGNSTPYDQKANFLKKYYKKHHKYEGELQLVDGDSRNEGTVEIFHFGRWGNVCDDEFDEREADVVCRQLGFSRATRFTHNAHFGLARRKYWMDNIYCTGSEKRLAECRFDGWGSSDCSPSEAAGVICEDPQQEINSQSKSAIQSYGAKTSNRINDIYGGRMQVRLAGGRVYSEGRVEIRHSGMDWGAICGDGWSLLEASVVCRQLGLGYAQDALQTDFFGGNRSAISVAGVTCQGSEASLEHCTFQQHNRQLRCPGHTHNIAAVVCTNAMADLVIDHYEIERTAHLEDKRLYQLQCAMEENCLASTAYQLRRQNHNWFHHTRRLLKFTARIHNSGTADFRPAVPKHLWQFHQCHMHYHSMEVFATFDILDRYGRRVADGHKASFCLEDNQCMPGVRPNYACANYGDQGISVNCSDVYRYNIDCQWVDITELKPGYYTFKVSINPEFKVPEMRFDNNAAVCKMYYSGSSININDCNIQRP
ncbi:lysyl oxidase homolog 3 [Nilaparvata lugens]|uniref:lysyl oxidase homolog 3 n=1 Tax=Nilaparvata lugens TaxID=108931 RepID=UPI000B99CF75|nr:lysyl oxidase homolog 3 [Nilaparvata lugens]